MIQILLMQPRNYLTPPEREQKAALGGFFVFTVPSLGVKDHY